MRHSETFPCAVAAAAATLFLIFAGPAQAQYTYGAPDYNYDRGWYGTGNWYDEYHHYSYIYSTPLPLYRTQAWDDYRYYTTPTGTFDRFNPWKVFNDFDAFEDDDSLFSF